MAFERSSSNLCVRLCATPKRESSSHTWWNMDTTRERAEKFEYPATIFSHDNPLYASSPKPLLHSPNVRMKLNLLSCKFKHFYFSQSPSSLPSSLLLVDKALMEKNFEGRSWVWVCRATHPLSCFYQSGKFSSV
jgi:hypothetical protein